MQLTEDVHKIEKARGGNVYLVTGDDGLLLVDTGIPGSSRAILDAVAALGRRPEELRTIVLTHADMDHIGNVAELKERTGARVAIHAADAPVLEGARPAKMERSAFARLVYSILSRVLRIRPVRPDVSLAEGDMLGGFHVMHVPGHSPGSIALWREDGVVFAGDTVLSDRAGNLRPPDARLSFDIERALASAERIRALPWTLLLTGHGEPVRR